MRPSERPRGRSRTVRHAMRRPGDPARRPRARHDSSAPRTGARRSSPRHDPSPRAEVRPGAASRPARTARRGRGSPDRPGRRTPSNSPARRIASSRCVPTPSRVESHEPERDSSMSRLLTPESCRGEATAATPAARDGPAESLDSPAGKREQEQPEGEDDQEERSLHDVHATPWRRRTSSAAMPISRHPRGGCSIRSAG